jgi:hypothetical protein
LIFLDLEQINFLVDQDSNRRLFSVAGALPNGIACSNRGGAGASGAFGWPENVRDGRLLGTVGKTLAGGVCLE